MIRRDHGWMVAVGLAAAALGGCGGGGGGGGGSPPAPTPGPNVTLSGTVTFDLVPAGPGGLDYANTEVRPARGVTVQVRNGTNVLATTTTDDNGAYSVSVASNLSIVVRARAEMLRAGAPGWNVRVTDNTQGDALYVADTPAFTLGPTDTTEDVHAASGWGGSGYTSAADRSAGPFAILDTLYDAMQFVSASEPALTFPSLVVHWSPSNKPVTSANGTDVTTGEIGSSFYATGAGIYLLGAENDDTDEYDRSVISHEWGHYLADSFSRDDSVGGPHTRGDQLDLRVAFGEGLANALSAMTTGNTIYRDVSGAQQASGFTFNVEGPSIVSPNPHPGWYSEESVQELVYDVYDTNADVGPAGSANPAQDNVALGFGPVFDVLVGPVKSTPALTSIFPFINGLQTAQPQDAAAIDDIVKAENIDSIGDDYGSTQTDFGSPATPDLTTIYDSLTVNGGATNVCSLDDFKSPSTGSVDKLGSRRYLRFTAPTAGIYTMTATAVAPLNGYADPDMVLHQVGPITSSEGPPSSACQSTGTTDPSLCTESFTASLSPGDYILEVYEWTNTTSDPSYPPIGRTCFDVTVTQP